MKSIRNPRDIREGDIHSRSGSECLAACHATLRHVVGRPYQVQRLLSDGAGKYPRSPVER